MRKQNLYVAGWRGRPPSACRKSFRFIRYDCIKESTVQEMSDIDTFVNTLGNVAQTALWTVYESVHFECRLPSHKILNFYLS